MQFQVFVSSTFVVLCFAHVHHKHEKAFSDGHYMEGEHNAEFDRDALFGGEVGNSILFCLLISNQRGT